MAQCERHGQCPIIPLFSRMIALRYAAGDYWTQSLQIQDGVPKALLIAKAMRNEATANSLQVDIEMLAICSPCQWLEE